MNYNYITDFHKSREHRIGASDTPFLIPHPEIQIESLAAYTRDGKHYPCTALDLYNEKINGKEWEYSFPAEMGHRLEGYAIYEFIADNISRDIASEFLRGYQLHQLEQEFESRKAGRLVCVNPIPYNTTPFKHNTEAINNYGVAHADCVYDPNSGIVLPKHFQGSTNKGSVIVKSNGLIIDLLKPFGIQAKSANYHSANARKKDQYKGYDLTLKTWQGVPLKVYFQTQYEMALYGYDVTYLTLIYDTNSKHYWQIKANKNHQRELIQLAQYMKQCIDSKTPPKQLVMNSKDIAKLYPEIKDDFREVSGNELAEILKVIAEYYKAVEQADAWAKKEEDAKERMSVHLRDTATIKGVVSGSLQTICKWKYTGGGKRLAGLKEIGEREDGKKLLKYLDKNGLIKESAKNRTPDVVIKSSEIENVENVE